MLYLMSCLSARFLSSPFFSSLFTETATAADDELRLLKFAVNRLYPYAETCFRSDEIEHLNSVADDLRALFEHLD